MTCQLPDVAAVVAASFNGVEVGDINAAKGCQGQEAVEHGARQVARPVPGAGMNHLAAFEIEYRDNRERRHR